MPETKAPKPSLLRRIFGQPNDALSESNSKQWPELAQSWAGRQSEMPTESKGVNNIRPMNMFERAFYGPTSRGATYPWGTIALNRNNVSSQGDLDNLIVHELSHVGQKQRGGMATLAAEGAGSKDMPPYEQEAYDAENNRYKNGRIRLGNINLPAPINKVYGPVQR